MTGVLYSRPAVMVPFFNIGFFFFFIRLNFTIRIINTQHNDWRIIKRTFNKKKTTIFAVYFNCHLTLLNVSAYFAYYLVSWQMV